MNPLDAFDPNTLLAIRKDDPELDLAALAAQVLARRDRDPESVKSINGLLAAWARREKARGTCRLAGEATSPPKSWGFGSDGRFRDDGKHHRRVTECVRTLITERRKFPYLGPQRIAEQALTLARDVPELRDAIGESTLLSWLDPRKNLDGIPEALRKLVDEPEDFELWPSMPASTGAAEAIKRAVTITAGSESVRDRQAEIEAIADAF